MIYIITGIAKAGKTLLAREINQRLQIPTFSTDYIMMMVHYGHPELNLDIYASDSSVSNIIEPYVEGLIKAMIHQQEYYVIEGVHFNTPFAKRLQERYPNSIKIVYLGYKDTTVDNKVHELFQYRSQLDNDWIFNHQGQAVEDIVQYLIEESNRIFQECNEQSLHYIEISNINDQMDDIIASLIQSN